MSYRTTHQADFDIANMYVHGEQAFGAAQAERYQDGLFQTFELSAENPQLAHERFDITLPVRIHPYGVHIIVYTMRDADILIVRVLHGRQDWERWLS